MTIQMNLDAESYDIVLEDGCLERAGELLDLGRRVLIVTDDGVPEQYAQTLARQCAAPVVHILPRGEASKSLKYLEEILTRMLRGGFARGDCVVAVGGGMVGDLAGFAAASYMRGVDFYNIPTTVLSQVDSSIGGKTALNLDGIKNAVGAFYQPKKVLIDPRTLETLPRREVSAGLAEAVKTALICDEKLFTLFETQPFTEHIEEIIAASLRVKKNIVERDEKEKGLRRALNFGHTIGHGVESVTGLRHGECVALGMLAVSPTPLRARLMAVLEKLELPTAVSANPGRIYGAMLHDKKADGGELTVVRVETPGSFTLERVAPEKLRPCIKSILKEP